ncbi:MAG TPA: dephospho-CoA kinase [Candidatus Limnocylindria bacterium]|nr:dephospho-CoA kinase [Candidatus Limnocylindria bacterium]
MKVIGLTGNIGCGKSTVAGMLSDLGVAVIDLDAVARQLRGGDAAVRAAIERRFGTIDAGQLSGLVFDDPVALADLEAILHPRIRDEARARLAELAGAGAEAACIEAVKLLESPLHDACDQTWVVRCDETDAFARLEARGITRQQAIARMARQSPQAVKLAAADVVIDGSAPLAETRRQVGAAHAALMERLSESGSHSG